MRPLSTKIAAIAPSATIEITEKARKMQAAGMDVISLSIGEPDFPTPEHITDACIDALRRGETHYAPGKGIPALLSAIAEKIEQENNIPCTPDQVMVGCGAKDSIYEACEAVLSPGDEAIILDPSWVSYEPFVQIAGGVPVHHPLNPKNFQVDDTLLEKVTNKTRLVIINTPSNPSGAILNRESLDLVADICHDHDLIAISDEIYEKLTYGKTHLSLGSLPGMAERTITVNGFSKAYAMTGWRLGYAVSSKEIIGYMNRVQQHTISHPTTFAMYGGVAALKGPQQCIEDMRSEFEKRRAFVLRSMDDMGLSYAPADGAFYAYVRVNGNDTEVASRWLEEAHVAVTHGTAFNHPGWIRISYAASMERLEEAMKRISSVL
ncbi:pyridoxal phosphate-dependent aminotransferase [Methanospirillum stamsii]|uniref:Aminotransferase n=1 Tax=Methanospirillum stamsii TaxID=1277351 RepID=A0A2V2MXR0_9EURY|nr:pyridoxal phosphate-dependent aminotransferase [Methanospirillum stamsii]PWR71065.1 aspartate aminotransferase [Methanospirillum stamsii]